MTVMRPVCFFAALVLTMYNNSTHCQALTLCSCVSITTAVTCSTATLVIPNCDTRLLSNRPASLPQVATMILRLW